jgi:hypothetical protein
MAMPIIIISIALGVLVKFLYLKIKNKSRKQNIVKSSIIPFCLFLILSNIETKLTKNDKHIIKVKSEIILPYTSIKVYDAIKSVDSLDADKPFLMQLDLPVPLKCVLKDEKVGGLRTCYFEEGKIIERITELKKGKILKMDVVDCQLAGRKWLEFKEAIYLFEDLENGYSKITRITTYKSELYPRAYWKPLERIGIEQEHEYVFRNLVKDLDNVKY